MVVRQGSVQQYGLVDNCVCQRGKDMVRKARKKIKKSFMPFVYTTQVRSFMADSQQIEVQNCYTSCRSRIVAAYGTP